MGIDRGRHAILLEELIEKNSRNLRTTFQNVEHRMTLQEAVGSIRSSRRSFQQYDRVPHSRRSPRYSSSHRYERRELRYSPRKQEKAEQSRSRPDQIFSSPTNRQS